MRGLIDEARLLQLFEKVEGELIRYPAINATVLRRAMDETLAPTDATGSPD